MSKANILIVEDEVIIANDIASILQKNDYNVMGIAHNKETVFKIIENNIPDLILIDIMLNDKDNIDGINLSQEIYKKFLVPIIYLTAYTDKNTLERAKYTNPYGYILKPFNEKDLCNNIEIALYKHKAFIETNNKQILLQLINYFDEKISILCTESIIKNTIDFIISKFSINNIVIYFTQKDLDGYILYVPDSNDITIISNKFLINKEETIVTEILNDKRIKYFFNLQKEIEERFFEQKFLNFNYKKMIVAPLYITETEIGAIIILLKEGNFSENLVNIIEPLSKRLAMALNNSILYESLKESEAKFRNFTDSLPQVVCEIDLLGNIKYVNNFGFELFGYSKDGIQLNLNAFNMVHPDDMDKLFKNLKLLIDTGKVPPVDYRIRKNDGTYIVVTIYATVIKHNDILTGFRTIIVDLTDIKEKEDKIKKLSMVVEQSPVSVEIVDKNGIIEYVNPKFEEITLYKANEVIGKNPKILKSGFHSKEFYKDLWNTIVKGKEWKGIFQNKKKNGELFWESAIISSIKDENNNITHFVGIKQDITEKIIFEKKLEEEREKLYITLKSIKEGVITLDKDGKIILLNKSAENILEYKFEELYGKDLESILNIYEDQELTHKIVNYIKKLFDTQETYKNNNSYFLVSKTSKIRIIENSLTPIKDKNGNIVGAVFVLRDITEKYKMQEEIVKSKKLESVGLLAGGIAHDFNNILTAILGNITLGKIYTNPGEKIYEILLEAEKACIRSRDLTQQLLTFSKGGLPIKKINFIEDFVKESAEFLLRGLNIKFIFECDENVLPVEFDSGQINQVVNNIIINAIQAMPDGGILKIKIKNEIISNSNIMRDGNYVLLSFSDTGLGIKNEILDKIFDPYFTTKKNGSGLGLAIAYSIIQKHNGYIFVTSKLNHGTVFNIYLPSVTDSIKKKKEIKNNEEILKLKGRILFMDDEDFIRDVGIKLLNYLGLDVEIAKDGEEVLKKYRKSLKDKERFDIVIMDLTVPGGMGGKETLPKLLKIDPNVKAIVSSGYSNDEVMANYKSYGFKAVIVKPYRIEDLSKILGELLLKK